MGNEIGTHSYTHLIDPPTPPVTETLSHGCGRRRDPDHVSALPSYNGATLGMFVSDAAGDFGANTIITAVFGQCDGRLYADASISAGRIRDANEGAHLNGYSRQVTTITFTVPTGEHQLPVDDAEPAHSPTTTSSGNPKTIESSNIGITIAGAAVPGANDYLPDSQQILAVFPERRRRHRLRERRLDRRRLRLPQRVRLHHPDRDQLGLHRAEHHLRLLGGPVREQDGRIGPGRLGVAVQPAVVEFRDARSSSGRGTTTASPTGRPAASERRLPATPRRCTRTSSPTPTTRATSS